MKSGSHSHQLKWSMGALKREGGSVNITILETERIQAKDEEGEV